MKHARHDAIKTRWIKVSSRAIEDIFLAKLRYDWVLIESFNHPGKYFRARIDGKLYSLKRISRTMFIKTLKKGGA